MPLRPALSHLVRRVKEMEVSDAEAARQRLSAVQDFSEFIGQGESVGRLNAFGELYKSRNGAPEHILVTGSEGMGKARLARAFAKTYSVGLHEWSADAFEKKGDLTALLTTAGANETVILYSVHLLRAPFVELLQLALQEFRIEIILPNRVHPYQLKRFTCIGIAPRVSDVHSELLKCFALSVSLKPYASPDLEGIAHKIANENALSLGDGVAGLLASVSEGSPSTLQQLIRRFSRLGTGEVSMAEATRVLTTFGLRPQVQSVTEPIGSVDLDALDGVGFERLVAVLLEQMGFRTEMTRATGDGGIDIVADLAKPFIGGRYLIQCKRFRDTPVGAPTIREFYGAVVADRRAQKGIFITTSAFTQQAYDFARDLPLELIDKPRLRELLAAHLPKSQSQ